MSFIWGEIILNSQPESTQHEILTQVDIRECNLKFLQMMLKCINLRQLLIKLTIWIFLSILEMQITLLLNLYMLVETNTVNIGALIQY